MSTPDAQRAKRLRPLSDVPEGSLLVHEIYSSIQGESTYAGLPCTFVRTTGCNLRCSYCDTPHAFTQGQVMSVDEVLERVKALGSRLVEVTGGEPLLQSAALTLLTRLCDEGYEVLLETSGSLDIEPVDQRVARIVDFKTPSSGEVQANLWSNVKQLRPHDEVKLVIGGREDYEWARDVVRQHHLHEICTVLMGAVWGKLAPSQLAAWIVEDRMPVRMQLQQHKLIWDPDARGV